MLTSPFLTLLSPDGPQWVALVPSLHFRVTAPTRDSLIDRARERIALALHASPLLPPACTLEELAAAQAGMPGATEVVLLDPSP
ncbi:hypothetical protein LAJ19_15350 (plasmid) [Deinococcus taeanensis]|uniref:hypothetical protein n=1 Tax=Deinococcus taeanensis TaxID=2737050 RepID=UPI001CDCC8B5|nr:hypothetical protein [Deinococcus taeanensis]UBV44178.1 hypothetical protein LAJ19_15350 [Deinococcus taeanensis]